jgi:peptidase M15-like protein
MTVPARYRKLWARPWTLRARSSPGFKKWLLEEGLLSPNFAVREARCKDGSPVPHSLIPACQRHAFNMERLRHRLGDRPIPITSWYRTPSWNAHVGGARGSKHIDAVATDIPVEFVERVGTHTFDRHANIVFRNGGFGQYPGGARHTDTRGYRSRWTSWTR